MATARVTQAAERALAALKAAVADPGTDKNRRAAETLIQLRRQFKYEGMSDWAGRSSEYRDLVERLYREAEVPSDSESSFQANLRYHLGNVLRNIAPAEELATLGLSVEGPLGRVRQTRALAKKNPRLRTRVMGDPLALADAALGMIKALRTMETNGAGGKVEHRLRAIVDEAMDVIGELNEV